MKIEEQRLRDLVGALIRLNNISQGKAADLSSLTRQNVSSWYTGRDNAISKESKLRLLDTLGVRYGMLRTDGVHQWCVREVEDAANVLREVLRNEDRAKAELWHIHNSRHIGCVVLKVVRPSETIWVLMYRPLMSERPKPIDAESLRCGKNMGEVIIDNSTWESWLPPAVLEPVTFSIQLNKLISQFPYPIPPQEHFDEMEEPDGENDHDLNQDELSKSQAPTSEENKEWCEVLLQAKLRGKTFDKIVSTTRKALDISELGSKKG